MNFTWMNAIQCLLRFPEYNSWHDAHPCAVIPGFIQGDIIPTFQVQLADQETVEVEAKAGCENSGQAEKVLV